MPFALVLLGLILIISGVKNTHRALGQSLVDDFTGPGNFFYWVGAIGAVGAVGYWEKARPLSHAFLVLILVAMVLSNGGFFARLQEAFARGPVAPPRPETAGQTFDETGQTPGAAPQRLPNATDAQTGERTNEFGQPILNNWWTRQLGIEVPTNEGGGWDIGRTIQNVINQVLGIRPAF